MVTYRRIGMKHAAYKILVDTGCRILGAHIPAGNSTGLIHTFKQAMLEEEASPSCTGITS